MIGSCKGDANKARILREYDLVPLLQLKLLNAQSIHGCCGDITDRYYQFQATPKQGSAGKVEVFVVGHHCAEEFCTRLGVSKPDLFNPIAQPRQRSSAGNGTGAVTGLARVPRHPLNQEIWEAISLVCSAWGGKPPNADGIFATLLIDIARYPTRPRHDYLVENLNVAITKSRDPRDIYAMQADLKALNPAMRAYDFPLMSQILAKANVSDKRL